MAEDGGEGRNTDNGKIGSGVFFFFKQKTAYEVGTGDWSSDVCLPISKTGQYEKRDAAAARNEHYKKRGRCRNEKWSVKKDRKSVV